MAEYGRLRSGRDDPFSSSVVARRAVVTAVGWHSTGDCSRYGSRGAFHCRWWPVGPWLLRSDYASAAVETCRRTPFTPVRSVARVNEQVRVVS